LRRGEERKKSSTQRWNEEGEALKLSYITSKAQMIAWKDVIY